MIPLFSSPVEHHYHHYYKFKYNNMVLNYYMEYLNLYKDYILYKTKENINLDFIKTTIIPTKTYNSALKKCSEIFWLDNKSGHRYGNCNIVYHIPNDKTISSIVICKEFIVSTFNTKLYINEREITNQDFIKDVIELLKSIYEKLSYKDYDNRVYNFVFLEKI